MLAITKMLRVLGLPRLLDGETQSELMADGAPEPGKARVATWEDASSLGKEGMCIVHIIRWIKEPGDGSE